MNGDWWIKVRIDLRDEPQVVALAERLGLDPDTIVGKLVVFWGWCKRTWKAGQARGVSAKAINTRVRQEGFAEAMVRVGWLVLNESGAAVPDHKKYLGGVFRPGPAEQANFAEVNAKTTTTDKIREEEKREDKDPPNPPKGGAVDVPVPECLRTDRFLTAWNDWLTYRKQRRLAHYTAMGLKKLFTQLSGLGPETAARAIDHSITMNYQGIFVPSAKEKSGDGTNATLGRVKPPPNKYAHVGETVVVSAPAAPEGAAGVVVAGQGPLAGSDPRPGAEQDQAGGPG